MHDHILKWEYYLSHWKDSLLRDKKVQTLWKMGLPSRVRGVLWQKAIGNESRITRDLFEILKRKKSTFILDGSESSSSIEDMKHSPVAHKDEAPLTTTKNSDSGAEESEEVPSGNSTSEPSPVAYSADREGSIALIRLDLERTFPHLRVFQKGGPYHNSFKTILECFTKYRLDIGYVQGQSFLLAMLLLNMETYEAFVCFTTMLTSTRYHFNDFFRMDLQAVQLHSETLRILLHQHLPALYSNFKRMQIDVSVFVLNWFITLFSKSFPLEISSRLWDLYLLHGSWYIYQETLGIFKFLISDFNLLNKSFEECMFLLSHDIQKASGQEIDETRLFNSILSIHLNEQKIVVAQEQGRKALLSSNGVTE